MNPKRAFPSERCRFPLPQLLIACLATICTSWAAGPTLGITRFAGGQLEVHWTNEPIGLILETAARLDPLPVWLPAPQVPVASGPLRTVTLSPVDALRFYRLRLPGLATVEHTSPDDGESGVSLTRETILRFSSPLATGTQLATDRFYAEFGSRKVLSRVELSSDRRQATLFYLEPLPAASQVRVTFLSDNLQTGDGQPLDGDGDGQAGGRLQFSFHTMTTAAVPNTAVIGHVYASDPVPGGPGSTNRPLAGVIITVDGAEERLRTETDEDGFFRLSPCPGGRFFVHIDGRPALGSDWPNGAYYPFVGKTFEAIPGRTNNLAGGTGEVFLPLVSAGTLQPISATKPTTITFPPGVLAGHPELAGVTLTVPPNALYDDNGTRGGRVGIAPVAPDRIPSPLPPGLELPLVITIQTDGPANFDQPVPVLFPNLPLPSTGQPLPPGAKSALWSYNHDTGQWEIQGSMTVTPDGKFLATDPGVGIRQPGWHGGSPGSTGSGGGGHGGGPCQAEQQALEDALLSCAIGQAINLLELAPVIGCGISIGTAAASALNACADPNNSCAAAMAYNAFFGAAGCVPGVNTFTGLLQCGLEIGDALADLSTCQSLSRTAVHLATDDPMALQNALSETGVGLCTSILGDSAWLDAASSDGPNMAAFADALVAALDPGSDAGSRLSATERSALLALPAPGGLSSEIRNALLDRFDRFAAGGITASERNVIQLNAANFTTICTTAQDRGWETMFDGMQQTWLDTVSNFDAAASGSGSAGGAGLMGAGPGLQPGPLHQRTLYYRLVDGLTGAYRYGRTDTSGTLRQLIVPFDRQLILSYLDPVTLEIGTVYFRSSAAGTQFQVPRAHFVHADGPDADQDGLTDEMESIVGTRPDLADTDGDGSPDLTELRQGQNPNDGVSLPQGVVANLLLGGSAGSARALGLHLDGTTAFIANGKRGLAIVDVASPMQPNWISELDLLGESFDITYSPEHRTVGLLATPELFIPGERGLLHIVDVSNPNAPRLVQSYSQPVAAIDAWNGRFYVAIGQFAAREVRIYDPGSGLELGNFITQDYPTGLRVVGGRAYVVTSSGLEIYDVTTPAPLLLGRLAGDFTPELLGRNQLVLDGTTLYVGKTKGAATIDVSSPAAPHFIGQSPDTAGAVRALALNGGGRMITLSVGFPGGNVQAAATVAVFNVTDPANLTGFELGFTTPGRTRDLVQMGGFALVADDTAGLTVLNIAGPDMNRLAPAVTFNPAPLDLDPQTPGTQVSKGATLEFTPHIQDDFQLDRTELLVNGESVDVNRSYPATFRYPVLGSTQGWIITNLVVQFRATDRSGNVTLSPPTTLELTPDTQGPVLTTALPENGGATFTGQPLVLAFNEAIDAFPPDLAKTQLVNLGPDGVPGGGDDQVVPIPTATGSDTVLRLAYPGVLAAGRYQLTLQPGAVLDRLGNAFAGTPPMVFDVVNAAPTTALWISDADGSFGDPTRWLHRRVPTQDDAVLIERRNAKPLVTLDTSVAVKSLDLRTPFTTANRPGLTVLNDLRATERVDLPDGTVLLSGNAVFEKELNLTGAQLETSGRFEVRGPLTLDHGGSLTFSGPAAQFISSGSMTAAHFSVAASDGAVISFPGLTHLQAPGDFDQFFPGGTSFSVSGPGSQLTLTGLATVDGPIDWSARGAPSVSFQASNGGTLKLPQLTQLNGRTQLRALGDGSTLNAPLLTTITATDATFPAGIEASSRGQVVCPQLGPVTRCTIILTDDGLLDPGTLELKTGAVLRGVGTLAGNVSNEGTIAPDRTPGRLIIQGNLALKPAGVLNISLGLGGNRTDSGLLDVRGTTALDGTLKVTKGPGYTPAAGQQFTSALFSQPPVGQFVTIDDAALGASLKLEPTLSAANLSLRIAAR